MLTHILLLLTRLKEMGNKMHYKPFRIMLENLVDLAKSSLIMPLFSRGNDGQLIFVTYGLAYGNQNHIISNKTGLKVDIRMSNVTQID